MPPTRIKLSGPASYKLDAGSNLKMRFNTDSTGDNASATFDDFTWDSVNLVYRAVHVDVVIEFYDDGSFYGTTGTPPSQKVYSGTYAPV